DISTLSTGIAYHEHRYARLLHRFVTAQARDEAVSFQIRAARRARREAREGEEGAIDVAVTFWEECCEARRECERVQGELEREKRLRCVAEDRAYGLLPRVEDLKGVVLESRERVAELEELVDASVVDLELAESDRRDAETTVRGLQDRVRELEGTVSIMTAEAQRRAEEAESFKAGLESRVVELERLVEEVKAGAAKKEEEMTNRVRELEDALSAADDREAGLSSRVVELESRESEWTSRVEALTADIDSRAAQAQLMGGVVLTLAEEAQGRTAQVERLESLVSTLMTEAGDRASLALLLENTRAHEHLLERDLRSAQEERSRLRVELRWARQTVESLDAAYASLLSDFESVQAERGGLVRRAMDLEQDLQALRVETALLSAAQPVTRLDASTQSDTRTLRDASTEFPGPVAHVDAACQFGGVTLQDASTEPVVAAVRDVSTETIAASVHSAATQWEVTIPEGPARPTATDLRVVQLERDVEERNAALSAVRAELDARDEERRKMEEEAARRQVELAALREAVESSHLEWEDKFRHTQEEYAARLAEAQAEVDRLSAARAERDEDPELEFGVVE
ncbi:hypothetical protein HK104_006994, partial [Borealophlyctis nickersoniae]